MAGNTEEAVAGVPAEAANAQEIPNQHKSTLVYISERIFRYLFGTSVCSDRFCPLCVWIGGS